MRIATTRPLFAWDALDDHPDLQTLQRLLDLPPDEKLLAALRQRRYKGRDDYPVRVLWRVHLIRYALRHVSLEACLAELRRNPALRQVALIDSVRWVPKPWNMSRFEQVLGEPEPQALRKAMFQQMVGRLAGAVDDLGRHTAGDASCLSARRGESADAGPLPPPTGGRKEYHDAQGQVVKVYQWFGYKIHLLVDIRHEVIVAWHITSATDADAGQIPELLAQARQVLPADRLQSLAYDKAADDEKTHANLAAAGIRPVIQNRALWKEESERMLPGHDGKSHIVYDEAGTLYCYDKVSFPPVKHKMSYAGYEQSRVLSSTAARPGTSIGAVPAKGGAIRTNTMA